MENSHLTSREPEHQHDDNIVKVPLNKMKIVNKKSMSTAATKSCGDSYITQGLSSMADSMPLSRMSPDSSSPNDHNLKSPLARSGNINLRLSGNTIEFPDPLIKNENSDSSEGEQNVSVASPGPLYLKDFEGPRSLLIQEVTSPKSHVSSHAASPILRPSSVPAHPSETFRSFLTSGLSISTANDQNSMEVFSPTPSRFNMISPVATPTPTLLSELFQNSPTHRTLSPTSHHYSSGTLLSPHPSNIAISPLSRQDPLGALLSPKSKISTENLIPARNFSQYTHPSLTNIQPSGTTYSIPASDQQISLWKPLVEYIPENIRGPSRMRPPELESINSKNITGPGQIFPGNSPKSHSVCPLHPQQSPHHHKNNEASCNQDPSQAQILRHLSATSELSNLRSPKNRDAGLTSRPTYVSKVHSLKDDKKYSEVKDHGHMSHSTQEPVPIKIGSSQHKVNARNSRGEVLEVNGIRTAAELKVKVAAYRQCYITQVCILNMNHQELNDTDPVQEHVQTTIRPVQETSHSFWVDVIEKHAGQRDFKTVEGAIEKIRNISKLDYTIILGMALVRLVDLDVVREDVIMKMLQYKADVNSIDKDDMEEPTSTVLHKAAKHGYSGVIKLLCHYGAHINKEDVHGRGPLFVATEGNHVSTAYALIERGADVFHCDYDGWTPIHLAASKGYTELIKLFCEAGADPNMKYNDGWTALHLAASGGFVKAMKCLIDYGGNPFVFDNFGWTPFWCAVSKGRTKAVDLLLHRCNQDINQRDGMGCTALHMAAMLNQHEVVHLLLAMKANPNLATFKTGATPLHLAMSKGFRESAQLLVEEGKSDINKEDAQGASPLHATAMHGHYQGIDLYVKLFTELKLKVEWDKQDHHGRTPLHRAASQGHVHVCQILFAMGVDMNKKDYRGITAFDLAQQHHHAMVMAAFQTAAPQINFTGLDSDTKLGKDSGQTPEREHKVWKSRKSQNQNNTHEDPHEIDDGEHHHDMKFESSGSEYDPYDKIEMMQGHFPPGYNPFDEDVKDEEPYDIHPDDYSENESGKPWLFEQSAWEKQEWERERERMMAQPHEKKEIGPISKNKSRFSGRVSGAVDMNEFDNNPGMDGWEEVSEQKNLRQERLNTYIDNENKGSVFTKVKSVASNLINRVSEGLGLDSSDESENNDNAPLYAENDDSFWNNNNDNYNDNDNQPWLRGRDDSGYYADHSQMYDNASRGSQWTVSDVKAYNNASRLSAGSSNRQQWSTIPKGAIGQPTRLESMETIELDNNDMKNKPIVCNHPHNKSYEPQYTPGETWNKVLDNNENARRNIFSRNIQGIFGKKEKNKDNQEVTPEEYLRFLENQDENATHIFEKEEIIFLQRRESFYKDQTIRWNEMDRLRHIITITHSDNISEISKGERPSLGSMGSTGTNGARGLSKGGRIPRGYMKGKGTGLKKKKKESHNKRII